MLGDVVIVEQRVFPGLVVGDAREAGGFHSACMPASVTASARTSRCQRLLVHRADTDAHRRAVLVDQDVRDVLQRAEVPFSLVGSIGPSGHSGIRRAARPSRPAAVWSYLPGFWLSFLTASGCTKLSMI